MKNVVKFPPPRRFCVEDSQDNQGEWTVWKIIEVTGNEALVYIVGNDDPWAGESIETIINNCLDNVYGYEDSEDHIKSEINFDLYKQAIKIAAGIQ